MSTRSPFLIGADVIGANRGDGVISSNRQFRSLDEMVGVILGEIGADAIPSVDAIYTDYTTVLAVQSALKDKGFSPGKLDGKMGPNTAKAIAAMQSSIGLPVTRVIDYGVISALKVTPGILPPGVTAAQQAQVQAQVALDAATAAEHAQTKPDVQDAASQVVDAAPAAPPELKAAANRARAAVAAAQTPAQLQVAKQQVQEVAQQVKAAAPSRWLGVSPFQWGLIGLGTALLTTGLILVVRRRK